MNDIGSQLLPFDPDLSKQKVSRPDQGFDKIVTDLSVLEQRSCETSWPEIEKLSLIPRLMALLDRGWCPAVGYAAIQIGVPLRMALYVPARIEYGKSKEPIVLVNPTITSKRNIKPFHKEGCMSLPDQRQATWRYDEIVFSHDLANGTRTFTTVQGFEAAVIQHEVDHMDGILNLERVKKPVTPGVNDTCSCGSGKKFKRCCR